MTAVAIAHAVQQGRRAVTEVVERALAACAADGCNTVTALLSDRARARAAQMDARGKITGPLAGVPFCGEEHL